MSIEDTGSPTDRHQSNRHTKKRIGRSEQGQKNHQGHRHGQRCDFTQHPSVVNGFSTLWLLFSVKGGKHTRAAVGMASLPFNIAVEIDVIVEIE